MTKTVKDVKRTNPQTPTSLRNGRVVSFVHRSGTYDRRRNANKRLNRQADIRWRVTERLERT